MDRHGLITIQSRYTPKETMQRLESAVKSTGMTVCASINHARACSDPNESITRADRLWHARCPCCATRAKRVARRALLREKVTPFHELGLDAPKWNDDELIDQGLPVRYLIYIAITALAPILIEIVGRGTPDRDRSPGNGRSNPHLSFAALIFAVRLAQGRFVRQSQLPLDGLKAHCRG
jgi:hypothetical protein